MDLKRIFGLVLMLIALRLDAAFAQQTEYVLMPGDVVRVSVFQSPDFTVENRISESGNISFPLLGSVPVAGLTIPMAEQLLAKNLHEGKYIVKPQVIIMVTQMRGNQVSVLGQVNKPGRYPLDLVNMRVSEVLAMAGGLVQSFGASGSGINGADTVIVTGSRGGKPFRKEIDLPAIFLSATAAEDITVMSGDVIYVHRAPQYYIYGEVHRPGVYRLDRNMTVRQAIAQGGSLSLRGTESGVRIHRTGSNGVTAEIRPRLDDKLLENDVIFVREQFF